MMRTLIVVSALAASLMGQVVNPANGHTYFPTSQPSDIFTARAEAASLGGHLVTINDAAENNWLVATFSYLGTDVWTGLSDEVTEGTFVWDSGQPVSYTNWWPGEPNNLGDEDYVPLDLTVNVGSWADGPGNLNPLYGVIELPSTVVVPSTMYPTIQSALNATFDGDTIEVAPGTYFENLDFLGKNVALIGIAGRDVTTIDGGGSGRVILFKDGCNDALLRGFTITNGDAMDDGSSFSGYGGGIFCWNSSPSIEDCRVTGNTAGSAAGGVDGAGGGISCHFASPDITACVIDNNVASGGGGIWASGASSPVIGSCVVFGNAAFGGSGVVAYGATPLCVNCTVVANTSPTMTGGIHAQNSGALTFVNGISRSNQPIQHSVGATGSVQASYSVVPSSLAGVGNIDVDPLFVSEATGDLRLMGSSPCIDAGDTAVAGLPTFDFEGESRVNGSSVDIGADEFFVSYPGSGDDLILATGVAGAPTASPHIKAAAQGDSLAVHLESPLGSFDYTTPALAAQLFATGAPPGSPSGFPEVHIDPSPAATMPVVVLYDGNAIPFGPGLLLPGGITLGYTIPLFISGSSIMIQGFALAPSTVMGNIFFTATDAHEIQVQ